MSKECAGPIADFLQTNKSVQTLILWENDLGPDTATLIGDAMQRNRHLSAISLRVNSLGNAGCIPLARLLGSETSCSSLTMLDLRDNFIGSKGVKLLADGLARNTVLQGLDLGENEFCPVGIGSLVNGLKNNSTLHTLKLWGTIEKLNPAEGEKAAALLADLVRSSSSLTSMNIGTNNLKSVGAGLLADALRTNTTLAELNVEANKIDSTGAARLTEGLKTNSTLETLHLGYNGIDACGMAPLADALAHLNATPSKEQNRAQESDEEDVDYDSLDEEEGGWVGGGGSADPPPAGVAAARAQARAKAKAKANAKARAKAARIDGHRHLGCLSLSKLYLQCNSIGDNGAVLLADGLRLNKAVTDLNLR
jgi:Ran GTPase-activating protein (RanGAP) involved in mRNA processing and transport